MCLTSAAQALINITAINLFFFAVPKFTSLKRAPFHNLRKKSLGYLYIALQIFGIFHCAPLIFFIIRFRILFENVSNGTDENFNFSWQVETANEIYETQIEEDLDPNQDFAYYNHEYDAFSSNDYGYDFDFSKCF